MFELFHVTHWLAVSKASKEEKKRGTNFKTEGTAALVLYHGKTKQNTRKHQVI